MSELMAYVNLVVGGLGTVAYTLWSIKWWHRHAIRLFILNLLSATGLAVLSVLYALLAIDPSLVPLLGPNGVRYMLPLVIGAPVVARLLEYRRDQQRENYAKAVVKELKGEIRGSA